MPNLLVIVQYQPSTKKEGRNVHVASPCIVLRFQALRSLANPQIPFGQQPHLLGCIAPRRHAGNELLVLLLVFRGDLCVEGDDRQQVLGAGEHLLLDHRAQLFVAGPARVLAGVVGAGAEHEVDDLVAEVLGIADPRRLFDLLEFAVERLAIEEFAGVGVAVLGVLNPEVGVDHVAVEDVLTVLGVGLEVCLLQLLADKLGVAWTEIALDEAKEPFFHLRRELLAFDLPLEHVQQMYGVGGHLGVIEVEHLRKYLERKAGREPVHTLVDTGVVAILLNGLGFGVRVLEVFAVVDTHLGEDAGVLRLFDTREH